MAQNGFIPPAASPAQKVTPCCSAMATSKHAGRKAFGEQIQPGTVRHGRRDGHDAAVFLCLGNQGAREYLRVAGRVRGRLLLLAGDNVELCRGMAPVGGALGGLA
jgi:hypothetical protein